MLMGQNQSPKLEMLLKTFLALVALMSMRVDAKSNGSYLPDDPNPVTLFPPTETNVSMVRFYLWTRENPGVDDFDELFVGDEESILNSHFDPQKKTKVLAHGFTSDGLDDFVVYTTEAYLEKGELYISLEACAKKTFSLFKFPALATARACSYKT